MIHTMKRHTDNRLSMLSLGRMKTQVMMLLILVVGVNEMWGQDVDFSGTYYIASDGNTAKIGNYSILSKYIRKELT